MSNASIARRIQEVLDQYVAGAVSARYLAESVELHEPALEGIPDELRWRMQSLSVGVINEDVSQLEEQQLGVMLQ